MPELLKLRRLMDKTPNTPYAIFAKVVTLVTMNMRYEKVAFNRRIKQHPYLLTHTIVVDATRHFESLIECAFIESLHKTLRGTKSQRKEPKHLDLFSEIWNRYENDQYRSYINRYVMRIKVNKLQPLIKGMRCIDLGCGNGNFCFALLEQGAAFTAGIDFGAKSIAFATNWANRHGMEDRVDFKVANVYKTGYPKAHFDFAIQNGVFHHLDDEDRAIREAARIIKPGGWFWYYTDGEGGISYDLWDNSVHMLHEIPALYVESILNQMNISRSKVVHIMDGLQATYTHTSWDEITRRLARLGFGNFKRLTGGTATDFDMDVTNADPYGREKFGEGDIRLLARKLPLVA